MPESIVPAGYTAPKNPYTLICRTGDLFYISGQAARDPATGKMPEGIQAQTRATLNKIMDLLATQGLTPSNVVKVNVYLTRIGDFAAMNEVYRSMFDPAHLPARTTVQVVAVPDPDAVIEIDVIASLR